MPTTDELQAQINALQLQLNSILGMADDDYIHQYSGEEIDAGITAAGKAVRYDQAQSLTAAQQTQARGNIGAAPNGYGLGSKYAKITTNWDDAKESGIYSGPAPSGIGSGTILGVTFSNGEIYKVQIVYPDAHSNCSAQREMPANGTWGEWEWVNPPMSPGVEYRTTERYLGKPVYTMAFSFGALPNASDKVVAMPGTDTTCKIIEIHGYASNEMTLPGVSGTSTGSQVTLTGVGNRAYVITGSDRSSATATIVAKYIKTTD